MKRQSLIKQHIRNENHIDRSLWMNLFSILSNWRQSSRNIYPYIESFGILKIFCMKISISFKG